jgi:hypothetical protein
MRLLTKVLVVVSLFSLPMCAADNEGYIKARGNPTGAGLFVDGKYIGPAGRFTVPERYPIAAGEHEVTLRDPRFKEYTTKVTVTAKKTAKVKYKLERAELPKGPFGRLRFGPDQPDSFMSVTSGDLGPIYLNDRYWGFIDELNNPGGGMLIPPGEYDLRAEPHDFMPVNEKVKIEPNKVTVVKLKKR